MLCCSTEQVFLNTELQGKVFWYPEKDTWKGNCQREQEVPSYLSESDQLLLPPATRSAALKWTRPRLVLTADCAGDNPATETTKEPRPNIHLMLSWDILHVYTTCFLATSYISCTPGWLLWFSRSVTAVELNSITWKELWGYLGTSAACSTITTPPLKSRHDPRNLAYNLPGHTMNSKQRKIWMTLCGQEINTYMHLQCKENKWLTTKSLYLLWS